MSEENSDLPMPSMARAEWLRIYIAERDKFHGRPLAEAIVIAARDAGLAGATVVTGMLGFGADHVIHTAKILRLAEHLPIVIDIVDQPEKIDRFVPILAPMISSGLITRHAVTMLRCPIPAADPAAENAPP